jgi:hypothetical protein
VPTHGRESDGSISVEDARPAKELVDRSRAEKVQELAGLLAK